MNEERHAERRHLEYVEYVKAGEGNATAAPPAILNTLKVVSERTGGAYSLFELSVEPGAAEQPHIQHLEDECLYVLSGEFEFVIENEAPSLGEGDTVYVPKGTLHGFENIGEKPGKLLVIYTPGGSRERFIEEAGMLPQAVGNHPYASTSTSETDLERLRILARSHGVEIVTPHAL